MKTILLKAFTLAARHQQQAGYAQFANTDLEQDHETRSQRVDGASHYPNDNGCPGVHGGAASSDCHQTSQRGVTHGHDIPVVLASLQLEQASSQEEACETRSSRRQ